MHKWNEEVGDRQDGQGNEHNTPYTQPLGRSIDAFHLIAIYTSSTQMVDRSGETQIYLMEGRPIDVSTIARRMTDRLKCRHFLDRSRNLT